MGSVVVKRINGYFFARPGLTLVLTWAFTVVAVGIAVVLNVWFMEEIGFFAFLGILALPVALALYFRTIYGRVQDQRRWKKEEEGKLANQTRYGHAKKGKKKKR